MPTPADQPVAPEPVAPLALEAPEQDMLGEELTALLAALPEPRRQPYQALADTVATASVPPEQVPLLESVLELILGSGRVRHAHRAEGERILQALYKRTPRGAAADQELAQVNRALSVLSGQKLAQVRVSSRIPGRYTLMLDTETLHLELVADAKGLRIEKAAV